MADESTSQQNPQSATDVKIAKDKALVQEKLKSRGQEQMSYKDYQALKAKKAQPSKFQIPVYVKYILLTPFLLLFAFGILYIPYSIFMILTGKAAPPPQDRAVTADTTQK